MTHAIQYTIRQVPPGVDAHLKAQAKKQGVSLNKLLLEKIGVSNSKLNTRRKQYTDLNWMVGVLPAEEAKLIGAAITESREADKQRAYKLYRAETDQ